MKIYTKTGDGGETGLFAGPRVSKDDPRIEAYGAVDELNAVLGLARTSCPSSLDEVLEAIQNDLFTLGALLATPDPEAAGLDPLRQARIASLEAAIDEWESRLPALKQFILPAGAPPSAYLHLARTVCRRAERRIVTLAADQDLAPNAVVYINRLSDLLFVLARAANQLAGLPDTPWRK